MWKPSATMKNLHSGNLEGREAVGRGRDLRSSVENGYQRGMGFLKSKSSTALVRRSGDGPKKAPAGSNPAGMKMRLSSATVSVADTRDDLGTIDSSRDSTPTPTTPTGRARTGRRANQRQKKPTPAPAGKKPTLVTVAEKKPADSKSSQDNKKKSRSRGRETEERQSSFEHETSYTESYSSGSEDESVGNSTYESEDNTTGASFDSNTRRHLAKSARRHAAARRRRNGCATPPPRPEPEPVSSPVHDAVARFDAFSKLDDLMSPQSSEAEESNPSTESRVKNLVIDFVVQNEVNQLIIQNTVHGNVEKLHLHVSDGFTPRFTLSL
ncbi:hypothetical protein THAOC_20016 [Thalassiosira oceanica]|uniref:Uncharacterized protein n=1 Tax=Thalassiosira oceanica TaxID=159749 RepID=K0S3F9_THAOC|nr:hypothetical protein THAOC_20016 [Thalassiosira oceanica]|eukprot:EJK59725.1 hypothetical protein THAOC_20016 [Thalassiosira oceanica]